MLECKNRDIGALEEEHGRKNMNGETTDVDITISLDIRQLISEANEKKEEGNRETKT